MNTLNEFPSCGPENVAVLDNQTEKTPMQRFGERLKEWREERGLTRRELAEGIKEKSGLTLSRSMISYYESGSRMPYPAMLESLLGVLDITAAHLLGPDGPERDTVIEVYEVIRALPAPRQQAMRDLYRHQRQRQQKEKRQQKEDVDELKRIIIKALDAKTTTKRVKRSRKTISADKAAED